MRQGGIVPVAHSVLAVVFQRNLNQPETWPVGVSTYLALTFSTLLSSQGTDASFVLTLSGFPPGASLRYFVFQTLSVLFPASDHRPQACGYAVDSGNLLSLARPVGTLECRARRWAGVDCTQARSRDANRFCSRRPTSPTGRLGRNRDFV
ncbi:hypothetical protein C3K23_03955 [Streptomyces sp. 604F]|nr:hypothetical protein C3K23_03955 [Streptomyces sp. 604F]